MHPGRSAAATCSRWPRQRDPRRRVEQVLGLVGLTAVAGRRAGGYSLGMSQRLGRGRRRCSAIRVCCCSTSRSTGSTPRGSPGSAPCCAALAAEGRTVFVSSHLMSEMAVTADHLIVIGRGRLLADTSVAQFVRSSSAGHVQVRTPSPSDSRRCYGSTAPPWTPPATATWPSPAWRRQRSENFPLTTASSCTNWSPGSRRWKKHS